MTVRQGSSSKIWVLDRSFVQHQFIAFPTDLAPEKRREFIHMKVLTLRPYDETGMAYHWTETGVVVWLWDQARVIKVMEAQGHMPNQFKILPITVVSQDLDNGLRMLKSASGYEAQVWKDHALMASRYWAEAPSEKLWAYFCRATGFAVGTEVKVTENLPLLDKPWIKTRQINWKSVDTYVSKEGFAIVGLLFMMLFGYEFGGFSRLYSDIQHVENQIIYLSDKTKDLDNARAVAQSNIQLIKKLISLESVPPPLFILEEIAAKTLDPKARIIEFSLRDDKLSFVLTSADKLDPGVYVKAYSSSSFFENVNADPGILAGANILKVVLKLKKSGGGSK